MKDDKSIERGALKRTLEETIEGVRAKMCKLYKNRLDVEINAEYEDVMKIIEAGIKLIDLVDGLVDELNSYDAMRGDDKNEV